MPIRLASSDAAASPTAGRLLFVIDPNRRGQAVVDALRVLPGVARAQPALDLFGRSLHVMLGNYLTAYRVRGGFAALVDSDDDFLRATRRLADSIYATVLRGGGRVLLDDSATNSDAPHVIQGIYPDALFVIVDDNDAAKLVQGPNVVRVYATDTNAAVLRAREMLDRVAAFRAPPFADTARLPLPPIFVVGCPRSGTTWVQELLRAHPAVAGPEKETAIFIALRSLFTNPALADVVGRRELVAIVRRFARELFADYLAAHAPDASRFIEKTPLHADHLDVIGELFPEAYILGVYRDGRDVVRSLGEVDAGVKDTATAARRWVDLTRKVDSHARRSARTRHERYEAWLQDPVAHAADVLTWVGLPPDPGVLEELARRAPVRVSQYNTTGAVGEGKWRDLSPDRLDTIYRIAGARLVELGYLTERPRGRGGFRLRVRRR